MERKMIIIESTNNTNHVYQSIPAFDEESGISPSSILHRRPAPAADTGSRQHDVVPGEWRGLAITLCIVAFSMAIAAAALGIYAFEHED